MLAGLDGKESKGDAVVPPLISHVVAVRRVAALLPPGVLDPEAGELILGATTPDIRVLTRWERQRTHFFDLDLEEHQDSVAAFFVAQPQLRDAGTLDPSTRRWVCGFVSHLIMDEQYITAVYRPHFGLRSALGGDARANLLDRVLQFELDRRLREDREQLAAFRSALNHSTVTIEAGFIDRDTLMRWRDIAVAAMEHGPDWDRFAQVASRHLHRAGIESDGALRDFMEEIPEMLDQSLRTVGAANVDAFFEQVDVRTERFLREYLACP